jgi:predicted transcriptional regulator
LKYSSIDAIAIILESFKFKRDPTTLERILTRDELRYFFSMLQESSMLIYQPKNQTYKTTDKGMCFLDIYNEVEELVTPTGV